MNKTDYIETYENKLDSKTCNSLISYFEQNALWDTSTFSSNTKNTGNDSVSMKEYWVTPKDQYYDVLSK